MAYVVAMAHPTVRSRWRRFVERILPWYQPEIERVRDRRTEAIRMQSIRTRIRTERVISDYSAADKAVRHDN